MGSRFLSKPRVTYIQHQLCVLGTPPLTAYLYDAQAPSHATLDSTSSVCVLVTMFKHPDMQHPCMVAPALEL